MENLDDIELFECPECGGPGILQFEYNWCVYVECADCAAHTAEVEFSTPEERIEAAHIAARTWNRGKAVPSTPGS